jgi:hypothetical protein
MRPAFIADQIKTTEEVARILVAAGFKAEAYDTGGDIPSLGVFVTDPREPRALWEFDLNSSDQNVWTYQIGASVDDQYEGVVYEFLNEDADIDASPAMVARWIEQAIKIGIDTEDLVKIVAAYDYMTAGGTTV